MITVEPTSDREYILSVLTEPEMYAAVRGDGPENPQEAVQGFLAPGVEHFRVQVDGQDAGLFSFVDMGESVDVHASLLKNCRGRKAIDAGKIVLERAKQLGRPLTTCVVPSCKYAMWYVHQFGFKPLPPIPGFNVVRLGLIT